MDTPTNYNELVVLVINFINLLIPAIFGLLFVYFVWRVIDAWVIHARDQTKRDEGKQSAIVAVVVFVVMITAWGIVNLIRQSIFGQ